MGGHARFPLMITPWVLHHWTVCCFKPSEESSGHVAFWSARLFLASARPSIRRLNQMMLEITKTVQRSMNKSSMSSLNILSADKNTASLLDLTFALCFRLDLWIMTDSVSDIHFDVIASRRRRSRSLCDVRMRLISYRLRDVPDAFLRIEPLDSLLIHLMRRSGILTTERIYRPRLGCSRAPASRQKGEVGGPVVEMWWCQGGEGDLRQSESLV